MGGGGGGGSTSVQMRDPSKEKATIGNFYNFQENQASDYLNNTPLLNTASQGAQGFWSQLPGMLGTLGGQSNQLGNWLNSSGINNTIMSGGALTPQMERDVSQQTRNIASAQGNAQSTGALGTELLNRDQYRQQRLGTALGEGQGLLSQQAGVLGQEQAMQTGGLNQLLGVQNAATQNFSVLTNPILGYLGNLYGGNQQASIANAEIQAKLQDQQNSKSSGLIGGGASLLGSVAVGL